MRTALQMQCQQGFLHQILHVLRVTEKAASEEATQPLHHQAQRLAIRHLVARLGARPKRPKPVFEVFCHGASCKSSVEAVWLHRRKERNPGSL